MKIPIKKTVWGPVNSVEDLRKAIAKSGQPFGVDWSGPACNFNKDYPCDKTLYQYMGWGLHAGIDIPVSTGTEIFAAHDGTVVKTSDSLTAGIGIVLEAKNQTLRTVYWHLNTYIAPMGKIVKAGDLIAYSGNTGYSAGPHLHFEYKVWDGNDYKPVDPMPYFNMDRLVRANKDVFRLRNGEKDLFLNAESFRILDGRWDKIENVNQSELDSYPDGYVLIIVKSE